MEDQLNLLQVLEVNFIGANILVTIILITKKIMLPVIIYFLVADHRIRNVLMVICVAVTLNSAIFPILNDGWYITGDKFHMKAYGMSADIEIPSMNIDLVQRSGEWGPRIYDDNAVQFNDLLVGKVRASADNILIFDHYNQEKLLLIESKGEYYLIGNPDIEELYMELVRLGATKKIIQLKAIRNLKYSK